MFDISPLRALLSAAPTEEAYLDLFLNHDLADVIRWEDDSHMEDGLSREVCHDLVLARANDLLGDPVQAEHAATMISTVVPLARSLAEVDEALHRVGRWMSLMASVDETGLPLFLRIAAVKEACEESNLLDADVDAIPPENRAEFEESLKVYEHMASLGHMSLVLGRQELELVVTSDEILVGADIGDGDWMGLYGFPHSDQDNGDDGDDDSEPEDPTGPTPRLLEPA